MAIDKTSSDWRAIERWIKDERETLRSRIETEGLTHDQSQVIRGQIKQLQALQSFATPAKQPVVIESDDYTNR